MIRVSVFYPATEGASFDHDYYREKHVPLVVRSWSPLSAEIDKGDVVNYTSITPVLQTSEIVA